MKSLLSQQKLSKMLGVYRLKKLVIGATFALGIIGLSACNSADPEVVAKTGEGEVTKEEFYEELKARSGEEVLRDLITEKVLEDKYEVTDQDVESEIDRIKDQLGEQFDMWLMQEGIKDEVALEKIIRISLLQEAAITEGIEIDEDDIKAQYDREITEIEAKHILVEDEETANEIKEKLDDGEDFAKLAKEYSEDEASAENGGEVGYFGVGEMVPEFEEAAFELEIDTISEPVQSSYGFHIIQVTDKREKEDSESYDDMKDMIERQLISEKVDPEEAQKTLNDILDDAKIDIKVKDLEDIFNEEEVVG